MKFKQRVKVYRVLLFGKGEVLVKRFSSCLISFFLALNCLASSEFEPLIGSQWSVDHPNLLPFSKCAITNYHWDDRLDLWKPILRRKSFSSKSEKYWDAGPFGNVAGGGIGIIGGEGHRNFFQDQFKDAPVLTCVSLKQKLAFQIPIQVSDTTSVGPVSFLIGNEKFKFSPKTLHKKRLKDIFGRYAGGQGGMAFFVSAAWGELWNSNWIQLKRNVTGLGLGSNNGVISLRIDAIGFKDLTPYFQKEVVADPFILINTTQAYKIETSPIVNLGKTPSIQMAATLHTSSHGGQFVLPAGTPAIPKDRGFAFELPIQIDGVGVQLWSRSIVAIDHSIVHSSIHDIFFGIREGRQIYHSPKKSVLYRDIEEPTDSSSLGDLQLVWDGAEDESETVTESKSDADVDLREPLLD